MHVQIPDEIKEYEPDLRFFFDTMVKKLHVNRHKGFCKGKRIDEMIDALEREVAEVKEALSTGSQFEAFVESADIANQAWLLGLTVIRMTRNAFDATKEEAPHQAPAPQWVPLRENPPEPPQADRPKGRAVLSAGDALRLQLQLRSVPRWTVASTTQTQSVAEHSFGVAALALWLRENYSVDVPLGEVLRDALTHDQLEALYGDTPSPAIEHTRREGTSARLVKLADACEAWLFLTRETRMGNTTVRSVLDDAVRRVVKAVEAMPSDAWDPPPGAMAVLPALENALCDGEPPILDFERWGLPKLSLKGKGAEDA